jgi:hypothetical protein
MRPPQRRIDDKLRNLCAKVLAASDDGDLESVRQEFLALVHEKLQRLKSRAARLFLNGERLEPERRATDLEGPSTT